MLLTVQTYTYVHTYVLHAEEMRVRKHVATNRNNIFFMFYLINLASTGSIGRRGYDRPRQNVDTSLEVQLPHVPLVGWLVRWSFCQ